MWLRTTRSWVRVPPSVPSGRLAQRLERLSYKEEVTGSIPVLPTTNIFPQLTTGTSFEISADPGHQVTELVQAIIEGKAIDKASL